MSPKAVNYHPDGFLTYPDGVGGVLAVPIADAGLNQTLESHNSNRPIQISLDASFSRDFDGNIVSYSWIANNTPIASGLNPQIDLDVGIHTITLIITDDDGATDTDAVIITIRE